MGRPEGAKEILLFIGSRARQKLPQGTSPKLAPPSGRRRPAGRKPVTHPPSPPEDAVVTPVGQEWGAGGRAGRREGGVTAPSHRIC